MTRTSTDAPSSRFHRAFTTLVAVLTLLCGLFLTLGYLQGPKLSSARIDTAAAIAQPGQQLRLFANQQVAQVEDSQVVVTPDVAHSVTTRGSVVSVQFDARLAYNTTYSVQVRNVTSIYEAQSGTLEYSFTTGSPTLYYLDRATPNDSIVRTGLDGSERTVVYSAPRIQDFVIASGVLAVATLDDERRSTLSLVSLGDGAVEAVTLPEPGVVQKLGSAASGTMVAFTFTSAGDGITPAYSATLMTIDLTGTHSVKPVAGLDGKPIRVLGWQFMPTGSGLLALTLQRTLFLIDPTAAGSVVPLGQFNELGPVSRDGTVVTMTDAFGTAALTIADVSQVRVNPSPLVGDSSTVYLGPVEILGPGSRIEKLVIAAASGRRFASAVAVDDGASSRIIYRTPGDVGSIESFSVSPNGQYVAIDVVPDVSAAVSDGYYYDARATSTETVIVEIATGRLVKSIEGFSLAW